jgi:3'-phosphoadenosine 5'-phosphosulfate sulfotransferase (PAPS reductase)/FAD synthetase
MDHEQRINMKCCFKLKKNAKQKHEMLKLVYNDTAVTMKKVYKWIERFRNCCNSVEDEERSGPPSTSKTQENVERVCYVSLLGTVALDVL